MIIIVFRDNIYKKILLLLIINMNLRKDYELMNSMNLVVRSHNVKFENNEKKQIHYEKMYDDKKNLIKYQSQFGNNHNALHVFTGELHGGKSNNV